MRTFQVWLSCIIFWHVEELQTRCFSPLSLSLLADERRGHNLLYIVNVGKLGTGVGGDFFFNFTSFTLFFAHWLC